jgi:hypothetical protein
MSINNWWTRHQRIKTSELDVAFKRVDLPSKRNAPHRHIDPAQRRRSSLRRTAPCRLRLRPARLANTGEA